MLRVAIRPVSARSTVLSILLGAHPPRLSAGELVAAGGILGIREPTVRVALTRMVAAGDLVRDGSGYSLSPRLLERQARQDAAQVPATRGWHGTWEMAVVTASGRTASSRAALRAQLTAIRVAELREGVWMRPANLRRPWPPELTEISTCFEVRPVGDAATLVRQLWDLDTWAGQGNDLLATLAKTDDPANRFAVVAAVVRHLLTDPMLPPELEPAGWPGATLRAAYDDYRTWLLSLQPSLTKEDK
ncbi:MAG: PaaX family transcriptional regulator [Marmoricola sp.]|nr:PaaX family transcriptional regulator [Marmoricola sp.]